MRVIYILPHLARFRILLAALLVQGCAGGEQQLQEGVDNYEEEYNASSTQDDFGSDEYGDEYGEEPNDQGSSNYGNDYGGDYGNDSSENYGADNYQDSGNDYGGDYAYDNGSGGELVNNAVDDELFTNDTLTSDSLTGQALNNYSADAEIAADAALVNEGYVGDTGSAPIAGQSANALPSADSTSTAPLPGGIVKYVLAETSVLESPGGNQVRRLSRGDHPLVYDRGEYHQTLDGYVIPSTSLTTEATGRPRTSGFWR